ncbi:GH3 auxin-responsive promoter family protein, partial [Oligoflexia bacterium]|nr:GH3 auxin-responsive promoter family protein [Oligoflexia bacterium]
PRLLVTGRTSYTLSAFGEHLIGEEVECAVTFAAEAINRTISDYAVGALFPENKGDLGGHLYVIEFAEGIPSPEDQKQLSKLIDKKLCERNEDYEAHRAEGFGLKPPEILPVAEGTFAAWMKSRGKLGGQNKVPRIVSNQELFSNLRDFSDRKTS